jgi:hypothetical protein
MYVCIYVCARRQRPNGFTDFSHIRHLKGSFIKDRCTVDMNIIAPKIMGPKTKNVDYTENDSSDVH